MIGNSLISMTINARNLSTVSYGTYGAGPVRITAPSDQKKYATASAFSSIWGTSATTTYISEYFNSATGVFDIVYSSMPALTYVSCASSGSSNVLKAFRTCDFSTNIAFRGLVSVFVIYTGLFSAIIAGMCWFRYSSDDLRFFINAEKFKTTMVSKICIITGYAITFAGFVTGVYYCGQNDSTAEAYGRQLIFLFINCFAFHKMSNSVFPDLKHLDIDKELPEVIQVYPYQEGERCFANGWGCLVRSEDLVRQLEHAVLRAYIHNEPEHISVYGDREKLEKALYLIHLTAQPQHSETSTGGEEGKPPALMRRASTINLAAHHVDSWLSVLTRWLTCGCFFHHPSSAEQASDPEAEAEAEQQSWATKRSLHAAAKRSILRHVTRYSFLMPIAVLAINSLSNVASIAQASSTTFFTGYPINTGNGYPFMIDTVVTQKKAAGMQSQIKPSQTTQAECLSSFGVSTCWYAGSYLSQSYGSSDYLWPQWQMCSADTNGVLEAGYICPYTSSPLFYILIFIWVGWAVVLLGSSVWMSRGFGVDDARFDLSVERFRGSRLCRSWVLVAMLYTIATGVLAIVKTNGVSVIVYFNVLLYLCLNAKTLSSLVAVTSSEIPKLNVAVDFPDPVEYNPALVAQNNVLYSLEQALLKTFLTKEDKYIERVADKVQVETFLKKAYLHNSVLGVAGVVGPVAEKPCVEYEGGEVAMADVPLQEA